MKVNREQLHELIDVVDVSEYDVLYHILSKFIPEDAPSLDEIQAIRAGRKSFEQGEATRLEDIDWN